MIALFYVIGASVVLVGFAAFFGAPYVPSHRREVRRAFEKLYPLGVDDLVVDLGAGDGVILLEATRRDARAIGVELSPILYLVAKLRLRGRAEVRLGNMWTTNLPEDTTLVYAFSVSRDAERLAERLQAEATRLGHAIHAMTYGQGLRGIEPIKVLRGHNLYEIRPLSDETLTV